MEPQIGERILLRGFISRGRTMNATMDVVNKTQNRVQLESADLNFSGWFRLDDPRLDSGV